MNDRTKNNRTTNRPSIKQTRRGRAFYAAQAQAGSRSDMQRHSRFSRSSQDSKASQEGDSPQVNVFKVAERRHIRWEIWFVLGVILALALILGSGGLIAAKRSQDAMTNPTTSTVKTTPASSTPSSSNVEQTDGEKNGDTSSSGTVSEVDPALAARNAEFAVDPSRSDWSVVDDDRKVVYLTFDDGPSANTQAVLDILDRYGCKATFFTVGHNDAYFPMIAEAYKRGHTIGMHTYSHDYAQVYASDEAYFTDLERIAQVVQDQIGFVPAFIRFPGGSSNTISARYSEGIMSRLVEEVRDRGYQYYDWDHSFGDGAEHSAEELIEYACEPTDLQKIVILCHDSATKQTTVEALPSIIEHYQSIGYTFEALDRSARVPHHEVFN